MPSGEELEPGRGQISPEDRAALRQRAVELGKRLDRIKGSHAASAEPSARGAAIGQAFRIAVELVVGVAVGGFIGWLLDQWLGTVPLFLIVFLVLGFAAGLRNLVGTARRMQQQAEPLQRSAPSVKDTDDD